MLVISYSLCNNFSKIILIYPQLVQGSQCDCTSFFLFPNLSFLTVLKIFDSGVLKKDHSTKLNEEVSFALAILRFQDLLSLG